MYKIIHTVGGNGEGDTFVLGGTYARVPSVNWKSKRI